LFFLFSPGVTTLDTWAFFSSIQASCIRHGVLYINV
jgi:hypothetical protein